MHWQALQFVSEIKRIFPAHFYNSKVIDVGSFSVNGNVRSLFVDCDYTGIDLCEGDNVDLVEYGHKYKSNSKHDVAISCECFEHNPYYIETLLNMIEITKNDGIVIMTCATTGRPEHGTSRTDPTLSPGTSSLNWEYYKNLTKEDFSAAPLEDLLSYFTFFENTDSHDLYLIGVKDSENREKLIKLEERLREKVKIFEKFSLEPFSINWNDEHSALTDVIPEGLNEISFRNPDLLKHDQFKSIAERSALKHPLNPFSYYLLSKMYVKTDLYKSLELARCAHELSPSQDKFTFNYTQALEKLGCEHLALKVLKRISDYDFKPNLQWYASKLYEQISNYADALVCINSALNQDPINPVFLFQKLNLLEKKGIAGEYREVLYFLSELEDVPRWIQDSCTKKLSNLRSS